MKYYIQILFSLSLVKVNAFVRSDWPDYGDVPPINKAWTSAVLNGSSVLSNDSPDLKDCKDPHTWALTYDDGPGEFTEERVLLPLAARNMKATFFVVGQEVAKSPGDLKKIHDAGHQIGIHTWSHPELTTLSNDQIVAEIVWTARIIKNITGVSPTMFRPPFGDIDSRVRGIVKKLGLSVILWNRDTRDFSKTSNPVNSFKKWMGEQAQGSISLQHDLFPRSSSYIKDTLDILDRSSYKPKIISECSGFEGYNDKWLEDVTGEKHPTTTTLSQSQTSTVSTTATSSETAAATSTSSGFKTDSWILFLGCLGFFIF